MAMSIEQCVALVQSSSGLLVTAGAGMGVDSGLPDFRGTEGFWRAYPMLRKAHLSFKDVANPRTFAQHPRLAWGFYSHRLQLYRTTVPHAGFQILRQIGASMNNGLFVCTSNVDGQFQKAGVPPEAVFEIHGSIHHLQCASLCSSAIWDADAVAPVVDSGTGELVSELPRCPNCGALARPNILMFDDFAWARRRAEQQRDTYVRWCARTDRIVILELGAGTAVPSIRWMGEGLGFPLIRVNPREPSVGPDEHHVSVEQTALVFLTDLAEALMRAKFL